MAKFGGQIHCGTGDIKFSVVEGQDKLKLIQTAQIHHHSSKYTDITTNIGSHIRRISRTIYALLIPPSLFSLKQMTCHTLTNKIPN